ALGWIAVALRHNDHVHVEHKVPATSVPAACRNFNDAAFSDVSRPALLGPANAGAFADATSARTRIETVHNALLTFAADLDRAGIQTPDVQRALALAAGKAAQALEFVRIGRMGGVPAAMREVETELEATREALAREGILECL